MLKLERKLDKKAYFMSIDCGTQSVRILVFDSTGNLELKVKYLITEYKSIKPGWKEIHPDILWRKICEGIQVLNAENKDLIDNIKGITLSCQRDSIVVVDKEGKPLRDCIIWADSRKTEKVRPMALWANIAFVIVRFKRIGETFNREFRANWLRENEPDIWDKTHKYLLLSTYLNSKLTGKFLDSTASTIGHLPFDYKRFKWTGKNDIKRQVLQIDDKYLFDLIEPCKIMGYLTPEASIETGLREGLPVASSGSDKGCETIGVGCNNLDKGSISLGSQATIQTTSHRYFELVPLFPPFPSVKYGWYNPEITISRGYWMIKWFEEEFAHEELAEANGDSDLAIGLLEKKLETIPAGCEGLILQPYWGQELLRPEARGSIIGFSDVHGKAHFYRAIIEGIGFALREGIEKLEKKSGVRMEKIALSGGGSQSDVICQITANLINREVYKVQTYETTGLGAAIAGFVAVGLYRDVDEGVEKMVHISKIFKPEREAVKIYDTLYRRVYNRIYRRVKVLFEEMRKIDQDVL